VKVGVFAVLFSALPFEQALDYICSVGVEAVEIGCGGYVGDAHCKPPQLLGDPEAVKAFKNAVASRGLTISALSAHANPLHPNPEIGEAHREFVTNAILMAEAVGVETVVTFSGCPGGAPGDRTPNWVTCPWPPDFGKTLQYQWDDVMLPYWERTAAFAAERGVRLAIEMHPGFCVYNPGTLLRLRDAIGPTIGANFDPSHLFWQGVDLTSAIRALGPAIYHFHAKDTKIDSINAGLNGVLDMTPYNHFADRSWIFRTVGYGHGAEVWSNIISNLRLVGYDGALSIEHEDGLLSAREGFEKALSFLQAITIKENPGHAYWA
jgi:sugar phosphate isomerase/epimerase